MGKSFGKPQQGKWGASEVKPGMTAFLTDLEGDYDLWCRYVELSKVLQRSPTDESVELADGARFVYGGDIVDHSPGDLRLLDEIVKLNDRYPDRVVLIIGNRDVNKLRFNVELTNDHREAWPMREHRGVYWDRKGTPAQKLSDEELGENTLVSRLRWMLKHNMGAPSAFEARREELASKSPAGHLVDDAAVLRSFQEYAQPGGSLFKYLQRARLAAQIGDTLFVHGCLPRGADGWAPGWIPGPPPQQQVLPMAEWIEALEDFRMGKLKEVEDAKGRSPVTDAWSLVGGYDHPQPGSALTAYAMVKSGPDDVCGVQPTIISNSWLDHEKRPIELDEATVAWLREGGVRRIMCGHQPNGDAPLVFHTGDVSVVTADITYAKQVLWEVDGVRSAMSGKAVCEVILGPGIGDTTIHGFLSNDMAFEARLDDSAIGQTVAGGWRVKGRVNGQLLLSKNEGRSVINRLAAESEFVPDL